MAPSMVIFPIWLPPNSVNHRLPSAGGDAVRAALESGNTVLRDGPSSGDASDPVAVNLGEPDVAVGAGGDADWLGVLEWDGVLGDPLSGLGGPRGAPDENPDRHKDE